MQRAKAFFYVSLGILALAGTFHLGAQTADGQAPGNPVVGISNAAGESVLIVTENGDVHSFQGAANFNNRFIGNIFTGEPVQATETSWGRIKADRR